MRGKLPDGHWREPFAAEAEVWDDYTESNAWQASWWVPHDIAGLIQAHGGDDNFVAKLDRLFGNTQPLLNWDVDITGLIGQCAMGNEPSNHIPYLFVFGGAPWKTQYYVRLFMDMFYGNQPHSLPGNDDIGQISAWYLAGALGFYPVNPVTGVYVLGSPRIDRASINIPGTKRTFSIIADNNNPQNVFIKSVKLNGRNLDRTWITHEEIVQGGVLHFNMARKPNKEWGLDASARPPSGFPDRVF
jgi:predicted alpha-1,2-mannosidase